MIRSATIVNEYGDTLVLELKKPHKTGIAVRAIDGLGPVKATVNVDKMAYVDGSVFNSVRADIRTITFDLAFLPFPTIEDSRHSVYEHFPIKGKVDIHIETDRRTVMTTGYVESVEPSIFSDQAGATVSVVCPQPWFKASPINGANTESRVTFVSYDKTFQFPFDFENHGLWNDPGWGKKRFGSYSFTPKKRFFYEGETEVGVRVHWRIARETTTKLWIIGPKTLVGIGWETSVVPEGKYKPGDDVYLSTVPGDKHVYMVREGKTYNLLSGLDRTISWYTARPGDNEISIPNVSDVFECTVTVDIVYSGA